MPSAFKLGKDGKPFVEADPGSDLDYSLPSWLDGLAYSGLPTWTISPPVTGIPYNRSLNASPVTIDGVLYEANFVATAWIKDLAAGQTYTVNVAATFAGGRKDERSFKIVCKEL